MSTINAVETGIYVYAIIDAREGLAVSMPGIEKGAIEAIEVDGVAAVITRVGHQDIRPQRSNLAVHHELLRALVARQTVVPCAFGMVAADEEQLREVLRENHDTLLRQLDRFRGKMEMTLGVYWNTSNIFEFFVATNQELKTTRDRLFRSGKEPSLDDRMELGRLFASLLQQCRERHTQQVIDTLTPYCSEVRAVNPGTEQMIMKLVCLIPWDQESRFEEGIQEAARKFDDHYSFKYNGPWAPFDFVDVTLDLS